MDNPAEVIQSYIDRLELLEDEFTPDNPSGIQNQFNALKDLLGPNASIPMLEAIVSEYKKNRDYILEVSIPDYLSELGMSEFTLVDSGIKVSKERFYETKTIDAAKVEEWLKKIHHEDIIKDTVTFGKGEFDSDIETYLEENGYSYTKEPGINGQSLKKVIRDYNEAPHSDAEKFIPPPYDGVKVRIFTKAVIKRPKDTGF